MISKSFLDHAEEQAKVSPSDNSVRQRIIAGAREHFFARGFRRITMDDLAKEIGMSKKTFYAYFPSKEALVEAAILDKFRDMEADFNRITSESPQHFLTALNQLLACAQGHTAELRPSFMRDVSREAPEMFRLVESRRRELIPRYWEKLFNQGRRAGFIRKDIPVRLVIEILLGAIQEIMNPEKMMELDLTPKASITATLKVILEGVITKKGRSK